MRNLGPLMIMSDVSQFSWSRLACIHDLISMRQLVRVECVVGVMDLVEM